MQRRVAASLAQQALREFRDRSSMSLTPAAFRAFHGSPAAASAAHGAQPPGSADATTPRQQLPQQHQAAAPPATDAAPKPEPEARLALLFTCNKCDNRAMRSFSKQAYQNGVVIVQCPGCQARHLIADNLGWFGGRRNVEEMAADQGQEVRWHDSGGGALELTQADAAAWAQAAAEAKKAASKKAKEKAAS